MNLKKNKSKLVLSEEKATYVGSTHFECLEINYLGTINIVSLLSSDYIIRKSHNKIYILNIGVFDTNKNLDIDLFKYKGKALFSKAKIINLKNQKNVFISRPHIQTWGSLYKRGGVEYDWAYFTEKWENVDFDGKNNKHSYIYRHIDKNEEANTTTITRDIRKK